MRRTQARELLMQMLFQMEVQNDHSDSIKKRVAEENLEESNQKDYFEEMYGLITLHLPEIDQQIEEYSNNWKINRLAKVDLAILRLSIAELLYKMDIPDSVSINEAVDLAKKFGGDDSGKFVNGVLGKIVRGKQKENE
ncbi:transcription antitermination factor NusB [Anaerovorax sp. IOR16]|uniref:transcription antitermination factor NusB n=1 Tax=Anaerovorax sp. IOR16 TaxID=2773458 RepID=UPI0019D11E2B|nr:transcription antitermination factor NusB [Anaerovorax sp. IOR16]